MHLKLKSMATIVIILAMSGCTGGNSSPAPTGSTQTKHTDIEQGQSSEGITTDTIDNNTEETTQKEEIIVETVPETTTAAPVNIQNKVTVKVTEKKNVPKDIYSGRYSDFISLTVQATNNTQSSIRGVQGVLHVDDLFGENILSINWDLTGETIYSGQTVTYSGYGLDVNEFMDKHMKFYNTDFSDLQFRYEISKIVYGDGTTESA